MTQKVAAGFLGISRSKMTALRNGRLKSFTIDFLFSLMEKLEHHSEHSTQDGNTLHLRKIGLTEDTYTDN